MSTSFTTGHRTIVRRAVEKNEAVKVYAKLPSWFKVPTPLGSYNPDWAVLGREGRGRAGLFRSRDQE